MSDSCITNSGQLQGNYFRPLQGSLLDKVLYDKTLLQPYYHQKHIHNGIPLILSQK